jgi:hypothetical protein
LEGVQGEEGVKKCAARRYSLICGSRGSGEVKILGILRMDGQEWGVSLCLKNIREACPRCQYRRGRAKTGWSFLASEGSVVDEFRKVVLNWIFRVENEDAVGVERDFPGLAGRGGFR